MEPDANSPPLQRPSLDLWRANPGSTLTLKDLLGAGVFVTEAAVCKAVARGEWPMPVCSPDRRSMFWEARVVLAALGVTETIKQARIEAGIVHAAYGAASGTANVAPTTVVTGALPAETGAPREPAP